MNVVRVKTNGYMEQTLKVIFPNQKKSLLPSQPNEALTISDAVPFSLFVSLFIHLHFFLL